MLITDLLELTMQHHNTVSGVLLETKISF